MCVTNDQGFASTLACCGHYGALTVAGGTEQWLNAWRAGQMPGSRRRWPCTRGSLLVHALPLALCKLLPLPLPPGCSGHIPAPGRHHLVTATQPDACAGRCQLHRCGPCTLLFSRPLRSAACKPGAHAAGCHGWHSPTYFSPTCCRLPATPALQSRSTPAGPSPPPKLRPSWWIDGSSAWAQVRRCCGAVWAERGTAACAERPALPRPAEAASGRKACCACRLSACGLHAPHAGPADQPPRPRRPHKGVCIRRWLNPERPVAEPEQQQQQRPEAQVLAGSGAADA